MKRVALFFAACALALSGCTTAESDPAPEQPETEVSAEEVGPHAEPGREPAQVQTRASESGTANISVVDFGNVETDGFIAPVRGVLVTPVEAKEPAPLIVMNHLRAPNCADGSFAWPCPDGQERRFDEGMEYFGERLAQQGYATLIPDLTPVWVSDDEVEPYSQRDMWKQIVGTLDGQLASDNAGASQSYGLDLKGKIDMDHIGLVIHSRSVIIIPTALEHFGADRVAATLGYGAAFNADDIDLIDPPLPDVPTLLVNGDEDGDVDRAANWWLTEHIEKPRATPLISLQVPGFGHMFVNRELQHADDDRIGCDKHPCPDASAHEDLLAGAAIDWFNAAIGGVGTDLPLTQLGALPAQYAGQNVRWLVATNGENVTRVPLGDFTAFDGKTAQLCSHPDPMDPREHEATCPEPETGVITTRSQLLHLTGAQADVDVQGARGLAIHLLPFGTAGNGAKLTVTVEFEGGGQHQFNIDEDPALANMATDHSNGEYLVSTIRLPLPAVGSKITRIVLETGELPVELRGIDVVH